MTDLRIESWDIQVTDLGPENTLPQLRSDTVQHISDASPDIPEDMIRNMVYGRLPNIMPYPMQDGYTRSLKTTPVRMGVLENDYLRAAFLLNPTLIFNEGWLLRAMLRQLSNYATMVYSSRE